MSCLWLASCPSGSSSASKFGLVIFVLVFIVGICIVFWIQRRLEHVRTHHLEKRLRWIHNHNLANDNPLVSDEADLQRQDDNNGDDAERNTEDSVIQIDQTNDKTELSSPDSEDATPAVTINGQPAAGKATRPPLRRKLTRVTHTFDIEFEHLGLTLSNGTTILDVSRRFPTLDPMVQTTQSPDSTLPLH